MTEKTVGWVNNPLLPTDAIARKQIPLCTGVLDYFPAALAEIAKVSFHGNNQHNPGEPLHWARAKSIDQEDTIIRHLLERGTFDTDGMRHSAKAAWRMLALLQLELESEGAPVARGARVPEAISSEKRSRLTLEAEETFRHGIEFLNGCITRQLKIIEDLRQENAQLKEGK